MPAVTPPSKPSPEVESCGRLYRMVRWLDANKGAFCISRIIIQTGIDLRTYSLGTQDDPRVIAKLWPVLDTVLSPEEREALLRALRE